MPRRRICRATAHESDGQETAHCIRELDEHGEHGGLHETADGLQWANGPA